MLDYIPQDLLMLILVRLPVKSLFCFRCVSKMFRSLLSDIFITTLINNNHDNDDDKGYHLIYHSSGHYSLHHPKTYDEYFRFKIPSGTPSLLVNSCNGLCCLFEPPSVVVLWNPLFRKFLRLPAPFVPEKIGISELFQYAHGLGFDQRNNDYKVVRLVYRRRVLYHMIESDGLLALPGEAEVYSLSKRCWRIVNGPPVWVLDTPYPRRINGPTRYAPKTLLPAYVNGVIHWVCVGGLLLFDVSDEVFRQMKLPGGLTFRVQAIAACRGTLLACDCKDDRYGVWVMKEYGVAESWIKHAVIYDPDEMIRWPVSLSSGGELLVSTRNGELLFCDGQPQETKKLGDVYLDKCTNHSHILFEEEG
jgi:F-box interacting protein